MQASRSSAPHVVLRLLGKVREDAGVVAEIVQAPGRGAAGRAPELDGDVEGDLMVVLVAAPALGHDGADEAGIDVLLDRLARDVAVALGLDRALGEPRRQRPRALDELRAARDALHRRGGRQGFHGTHGRLPWLGLLPLPALAGSACPGRGAAQNEVKRCTADPGPPRPRCVAVPVLQRIMLLRFMLRCARDTNSRVDSINRPRRSGCAHCRSAWSALYTSNRGR